MRSTDPDARLPILNTTSVNLDRMLLNGETDNYSTEVDNCDVESLIG
jgi:hypothetical protein